MCNDGDLLRTTGGEAQPATHRCAPIRAVMHILITWPGPSQCQTNRARPNWRKRAQLRNMVDPCELLLPTPLRTNSQCGHERAKLCIRRCRLKPGRRPVSVLQLHMRTHIYNHVCACKHVYIVAHVPTYALTSVYILPPVITHIHGYSHTKNLYCYVNVSEWHNMC